MQFVKRVIYAAVCLNLSASAAVATQYICTLDKRSSYGWVSEKMYFEIKNNEIAVAYDDNIHRMHEKPIQVNLTEATAKRYKMKWTLKGIPMSFGGIKSGPVQFTATLARATNALNLRVVLSGYDNSPWGRGKCQVKK